MTKLTHNIQKKQHRERSQTEKRSKFGLLEKKKDYRLRANDYHKKQAALAALKAKAATYNPDEYYHSMTRKRTDDNGIIISDRDTEVLSVNEVKLLKTQDVNYIRTLRLNEMSKINKQKELLNFKANGKHTVFIDSKEQLHNFDASEHFNTDVALLERRENRLTIDQLKTNKKIIESQDEVLKEKNDVKKLKQIKLFQKRINREAELKSIESRMENTKELMKKGSKKKVINASGKTEFKWKNQRKR
ncbi:small-subunit processome [Scheffersomyces coipomensis]|uniref:small-subunit processome n=1 Tax=Scheffersomyces coipomensis TaxID=1788519 RepID=UPI00315CB782